MTALRRRIPAMNVISLQSGSNGNCIYVASRFEVGQVLEVYD
jgi:hypothetical protein